MSIYWHTTYSVLTYFLYSA